MSKYQYLAHLTEIATEIAQAKKTSVDEILNQRASLPRDKVPLILREPQVLPDSVG
jgi:hypothetical protein